MTALIHALTFAAYLAGLIGLGWLLLGMIAPAHRSRGAAAWIPAAFLLGTTALCVLTLPLSMLGLKTQPWMLLPVMILTYLGTRTKFPRGHVPNSSFEFGTCPQILPGELAAFFLFALLLAAHALVTTAYPQFDIDMIGHILMKAKTVADTSYAGAVYFHDPVFATAHNNYPPLTVMLHSFMFTLGLDSTADYQALNYIILFLMAMALHAALRPRIGIAAGLGWSFILISTADYLKSQFLISSTDIFLAFAILLTALAFLEAGPDGPDGEDTLFSIFCAACLLIKNDAVIFIALITLALGLRLRRFPAKHLLLLAVLAGPWMIYRTTLPDPDAGAEFMLRHLGDYLLPATLPALGRSVLSVLTHHLNWIFLIALCTWPLLWRNRDMRLLIACISATLAGYVLLVWGAIPISVNDETLGLMRLFSQFYPLALFITPVALHKLTDK